MLNKLKRTQLETKAPGRLFDGGGLLLHIRKRSSDKLTKNWIYRFTLGGKRCEMGLGVYPAVSLAEAREKRRECERLVSEGHDPRQKRDEEIRIATAAALATDSPTVEEMARLAYEAKKGGLKEDGRNGDWMAPLRLYIFPKIGIVRVTELTQEQIINAFTPIWHAKHPSAKKAMARLNITLRHSIAAGFKVDIGMIDNAKIILGEVIHEEKHHASLPFEMAPDYYAQLPFHGSGIAIKAVMLTGVRSKEVRFARVEDIDWNAGTLTARKESVKAQRKRLKDHVIPLSSEAVRIARFAAGEREEGILFPSFYHKVFSDNSLSKPMRECTWLGERKIKSTPHGLRSTFKTFMIERHPEVPPHITEMVLSHKVENDVGAAYTRTQLIDQQRCALERWGRYLAKDRTPIFDIFAPDGKIAGADMSL